MGMFRTLCCVLLSAMGILTFVSFASPVELPENGCKYTYLHAWDFRSKTIEVSNVFRAPSDYKAADPRYRFTLYSDSAEAQTARQNNIRSAHTNRYQLMLFNQADACKK